MKVFIKQYLTGLFVLMICYGLAFAGTSHSKIEAREHNQNKIAQGVENGQLTKKEAGFLQAEHS